MFSWLRNCGYWSVCTCVFCIHCRTVSEPFSSSYMVKRIDGWMTSVQMLSETLDHSFRHDGQGVIDIIPAPESWCSLKWYIRAFSSNSRLYGKVSYHGAHCMVSPSLSLPTAYTSHHWRWNRLCWDTTGGGHWPGRVRVCIVLSDRAIILM